MPNRGAPFGPTIPTATQTLPMKSSDDPGISGMPALPTPPDVSKSPVTAANTQYQSDLAKRAAFGPGPKPEDYKPSLGRKIGGTVLGALAGGLGGWARMPNAGAAGAGVADSIINSKFNDAQDTWNKGTSALDKQLEAERSGFGIAESAGKVPQEDFTNKFNLAKEGREQQQGAARIDSLESSSAQKDEQVKRLQDLIDHPKTTAPKNADEALAQAYLEKDPQKRSQMMDMAKALHQQEIDRAKSSRPEKEPKNTASTNVQIENRKAQALSKAKRQYDKDTQAAGNDPELRKQADDAFKEAQQDAQDAYENEIAAAGGSPQHSDWPAGKKPAASAQSSQPEVGKKAPPKVGDIVTLKGGKQHKVSKVYADGSFD
jgi:hypothetical protein